MRLLFLFLFLSPQIAMADISPGTIYTYVFDSSGNTLNSTSGAINSFITNTSLQVAQFGTWSVGRTWTLSSGTDSVSATVVNFPSLTNVNLTQVGGSSVTLGQKTMANGIPVTLPSDQSAIEVELFDSAENGLNAGTAANLANTNAVGSLLTTEPGSWTATSFPAIGVIASASKAAGGVGVRHVANCVIAKLSSQLSGNNNAKVLNLRDGASGAGTVLLSLDMISIGVAVLGGGGFPVDTISQCGFNIVGSANTAMTLEFTAAPGAASFEKVTLIGYDAQ